ncbi:MAG: response regulator, partial [Anaerolineales bacterium]
MADVIKVLIVDDIPETRDMLRKLLAFENDIEVVDAASTGREGLDMAQQYKPDIVLMDINMPDMDGIQATEEIKRILPSAGVIMMSVQSESDYLRRAMLAGARDFLTKPISGEDLYQTIRRVYDLMEDDRLRPSTGTGTGDDKAKQRKTTGHIIAVYSPQGGAGVTTIATNIAIALMQEGTRVLLADCDLQFGDTAVFLNLQSQYTMVDMMNSIHDVDQEIVDSMTVSHGSGLRVLLAPPSPDEADRIAAEDLGAALESVARYYDFVVVDMSHRLDDAALNILDLADRIVLVGTPTLPSVKNIRIILDLFLAGLEYPSEKLMFVMNRVGGMSGRASIPVEAIEQNLKRQTDARIPLDDKTFLSAV